MKTAKKRQFRTFLTTAFALALCFILFALGAIVSDGASSAPDGGESLRLTAGETSAMLDIVKDGKTSYTIIHANNDGMSDDMVFANELRDFFGELGVKTVSVRSDTNEEKTYEILLGRTTRQLSRDLHAKMLEAVPAEGGYAWAVAEKDGKIALVANNSIAFSLGTLEVLGFAEDDTFSVPVGYEKITAMTEAEYEAYLEANKDARIKALKEKIAGFNGEDFINGKGANETLQSIKASSVMPASAVGSPELYPTEGEHPRVGVAAYMLDDIREYLKTAEGQHLYEGLVAIAKDEFTGELEEPTQHTEGREGFHNVDEKGLAIIEARAFLYLVTGDEEYGYDAILSMKNYLSTLYLGYIVSDQCREFGRTMFVTAEIYDWCYPLLTADDKEQFMISVTFIASGNASVRYGGAYAGLTLDDKWMEVGYPPGDQGVNNGHGAEAQVLRDLLSISIAIYDENPSWYNFVAARIYNEAIPFRNYYFQSGMYPQGISTYWGHRYQSDVWSAWLLLCATGENPFPDDMQTVTNTIFDMRLPNGTFFGGGDGTRHLVDSGLFMNAAVMTAGLYGDTGLRNVIINTYGQGLRNLNTLDRTTEFSTVHHVLFGAAYFAKNGSTDTVTLHTGQDPVTYNSYPVGQMIARSEWDNANAPAALMLIGEKGTSNHEHADSGTFQLFYKGLYTGDTGVYATYSQPHWQYYHQATVAHNGLLVFNPSQYDASSKTAKWYTGGQRHGYNGDTETLDKWIDSKATDLATVTGHEYALKADGTADYAYIAGDISQAYDTRTQASYVGRNMLTVFTDDPDYPMYFIVFDKLETVDDTIVNKFLLHTPTEPVVDEANKTVTVTKGDARLVLHSLKGGDEITALGGANRNYLINGVQCNSNGGTDIVGSDGMWGRVEISNTGSKNAEFFNLIYFTDATNDEKQTPVLFDTESYIGTKAGDDYVVFLKSEERNLEEISLETEGTGLSRYIVIGLNAGTWNIQVDGVTVAHRVASEEGGMITFWAPAGKVCVIPGKDIPSANGGRIVYNTYGGIVPETAPLLYEIDVPFTLPEDVERGNDDFLGWYTSPSFEEETRVSGEVWTSERGKYEVYAKYRTYLIYEDYEDQDFYFDKNVGANQTVNGITYITKDKAGSSIEVMEDGENKYIRVSVTTKNGDTHIDPTKNVSSFLGAADTKLTFEFDIAKDGDFLNPQTQFALREKASDSSTSATLVEILRDGIVRLKSGPELFPLRSSFTRLVITVDFVNKSVVAYDENGFELGRIPLTVPASASTTDAYEWMHKLTYIFNWWMGDHWDSNTQGAPYGGNLLIDNVKVYTGDALVKQTPPENSNRLFLNTGSEGVKGEFPSYYVAGEKLELPLPELMAEQLRIEGWYDNNKFTGDPVTEINTTDISKAITLYAKIVYKDGYNAINYVVDGGWLAYGVPSYYKAGEKRVLPIPTPTESDEKFHGWYDNPEFTGDPITEIDAADAENAITLYAKIGLDDGVGRVKYEVVGGTLPADVPGYYKAGEKLVLPTPTPTGENEIFKGWYLDANFSGEAMWEIDVDEYSGDFKLYAKIELPDDMNRIEYYPGVGTVPNNAPKFYEVGKPLQLPEAAYPGGNELFDGWYDNPEFTGVRYDVLTAEDAEKVITLYAKYRLPDGISRIDYNVGNGELPSDTVYYYPTGSDYTLPIPTLAGAEFKGWYLNADFTGAPVEALDATFAEIRVVTLYALFYAPIFDEDFTDSEANVPSGGTEDKNFDGIDYLFSGKLATVVVEEDADGNSYIRLQSENQKSDCDPTIELNHDEYKSAVANIGKITYEIDLAVPTGAKLATSTFRIRGEGDASDSITIFKTNSQKKIQLAGNSNLVVATLGADFTKLIFTLDLVNGTLTAYSEDGAVLQTTAVSVPANAPTKPATITDWFGTTSSVFEWNFSRNCCIAFDNVKVYAGTYMPQPTA